METIANPETFKNTKQKGLLEYINTDKPSNASNPNNYIVYVGQIPPIADEGTLEAHFLSSGEVTAVTLIRNRDQSLKNYAYVSFSSPESAAEAVEELNFSRLSGCEIEVKHYQENREAMLSGAGNVFVKNINSAVSSREFRDVFAHFGRVLSSKLARKPDGSLSGYGFVQFEDEDSAQYAIEAMNGQEFSGSKLKVMPFVSKKDRTQQTEFTNVYVKNLSLDITETKLREIFSVFGQITSLFLPRGTNRRPKGFAFVNFAESASAKMAVSALNQKSPLKLYLAPAERKELRHAKLSQKFENCQDEALGRCVYVKNMPPETSERDLRAFCQDFGKIDLISVRVSNRATPKAYGYIVFDDFRGACTATKALNGAAMAGEKLRAELWRPKRQREAEMAHKEAKENLKLVCKENGIHVPRLKVAEGAGNKNPVKGEEAQRRKKRRVIVVTFPKND